VRTLKTSEAAALLNVSPNTIRAWERRFGFPRPDRSPGRHRLYVYAELSALHDALQDGLSISSAISIARERLHTGVPPLAQALSQLDEPRADHILETALALGSVECSVEETLLPSLERIRQSAGPSSVSWAFASRWAVNWMDRARRLVPPPATGKPVVLIGDSSMYPVEPIAPYVAALRLFGARAGLPVICLPVHAIEGLTGAVSSVQPLVAVLTGGLAPDPVVRRWMRVVASDLGPASFAAFRRRNGDDDLHQLQSLPPQPSRAALCLEALV
jgi:MerR family transcriptional regulator, light-induced transcriptional regulator